MSPIPVGIVASAHASTAFLPSDLSGLHTWYDADDASTFSYSSGTLVSQWRDKSGNGRHAGQATVGSQPSRNTTMHGRTAVNFSAGSRYLDTASFTLAQPFTAFIAVDGGGSSLGNEGWLAAQGGSFQIYVGAGVPNIYAGSAISGGAKTGIHEWTFIVNGASSFIYSDGVGMASGNVGGSGTSTGWRVGAERNLTPGYFHDGPLGEVIVYNRVLTAPERASVDAYLAARWL